jgi:hypothetical protein
LFEPKALRELEPTPPEELLLVLIVRLLPNMPEPDEPPPPMPDDMPPPDIPPPELPNCAKSEPALTIMPNSNSQERFNARRMANSFNFVAVND